MSLISLETLSRVLVTGLLLLCLAGSISAEDRLQQKWSFKAGEDILMLSAGDVNNDQSVEVVAVSAKKVYVINAKGGLLKSYPIDFLVSSIEVADLDGDGVNEIILGSGFFNTSDVNGSRFDFTNPPTIKEKPAYIYKVMHSQGEIYVIKGNVAAPVKLASLNDWVRAMHVDDIDENGTNELLVSAGGVNIDYVEKVHIEINPDTGNQTYVRNRTEISTENGSLKILRSNGSLRSDFRTTETLWSIASAAMTQGELKNIFAGGSKVIILNNNATQVSSLKPSAGQNISIMDLIPQDMNRDKHKEILASFMGPLSSGVYLLNNSGSPIWEYRIDSKNVKGLYTASLDMDPEYEIIIASDKMLYVIDRAGKLKWSQPLQPLIAALQVIDYGDSNPDFVMSSGADVFAYQMDQGFYKSQLAQVYYDDAKANFESARYEASVANLTAARSIYAEIDDSASLLKCDSLLEEINNELRKTNEENAKSLYNKGRDQFYYRKYDDAREYYLQARGIYARIADAEGVAKCDTAISEVEAEILKSASTSTQASARATTTTKNQEAGDSPSPIVLVLLAAILVVILVAGIILAKKLMNKDKPGV